MSLFFPYSPTSIIAFLSDTFSLTLSSLTDFEKAILVIWANLYFFIFWFIITYIVIKLFNRVWERLF